MNIYKGNYILNFMGKEIRILSIMKKIGCSWGEAEERLFEEKKLKEFF